jgi:hypothetical protein
MEVNATYEDEVDIEINLGIAAKIIKDTNKIYLVLTINDNKETKKTIIINDNEETKVSFTTTEYITGETEVYVEPEPCINEGYL